MPAPRLDIDAEFDRLYQLPLGQFVQARNELAARLRADGQAAAAMRVHSMAKPTLSAWAVNQVYWRARAEFDALVRAGQRLRAVQESALQGQRAEVREASQARDAALVAALERTLALVGEDGQAVTPAMRLRIATNLDAVAAYGGAPPGGSPGRLSEDLDPPGFDVLAVANAVPAVPTAAPARERGPAKVVSFEEIARARRDVAEAERAVSQRRAEARQASGALDEARHAVKTSQTEADRAKRAWEAAAARVAELELAVSPLEKQLERARQAAAEAEQHLERVRAVLESVKKPGRK